MNLLMITGNRAIAQGDKGTFYQMLKEFSLYWDRIDILCPKTIQKAFKIHENVFIHVSPYSLIFHPFFIRKKGEELYKKHNYHFMTVHEFPPFYNGLGARILFQRVKVPYLLEIHHVIGYPRAPNFKEWFYKILTKFFINWDAKKAKAVRVINQKQVPYFLKKSGLPKEKIKYISAFYLDFNIFKPQTLGKKYDLVFCGRLARNKGALNLLKALKIIRTEVPNIKLAIVGGGALQKKIEKWVSNKKLTNNIIVLGRLPELEDVARVFNQSKILIMPSFNEGGPRVTLEAMACGIPVITTRVGIMNELIKDKENGIFIDWSPKDIAKKSLFLLNSHELRKKIAIKGKYAVQQFEKKKMIKNYALSCQKLIK